MDFALALVRKKVFDLGMGLVINYITLPLVTYFNKLHMNFEIIPNEQTPKLGELTISDDYLNVNREWLSAFLDFAKTHHYAVGLAANQCSLDGERIAQRVFAIRNRKTDTWELILNPIIDKYIGMKELKAEGCLTWRGKTIVAERNRAIEVSYYDIDGKLHSGKLIKGFEAEIWQHEVDHLNGVEEKFIDGGLSIKTANPGRNEPCPCGSGKKYKQCCLQYE